ncbi:hypothetical protein COY59_03670 [Candidatus Gottesmanbacteria bacterium CG_4_10_14_0_8_um_filter_37_24]|uniref:NYN domain-containing protein n=2 Tax=Candidatus Gottesmaniibacteriota TaxID=1752720 RepID=A0A2M7RQT9_9BACT|nr:MAG: hypothetical protein AUJ73_01685 [Candidatus Gottesmanbacteria bacterium CG1_02_37_22]PIP33034.1 MAG: hypothetical protein COX23_01530 [Candidatus Gottesmanbacteria bacterium CG23_combo_of_CG06-09_8_20_14_all_37_19]PIZ02652.1 MAG: hypothetical protein COY59_03670 [Candidatus Gottesmanbacteria bacterium CG_4_10_14_0_8_um_filter_37_24]
MIEKYIKGKISVFIDAANILYSQQTMGWEVDYKRLIEYFKKNFHLVFIGFYYGRIKENKGQEKFFQMLTDRGYTLRTKPVKYIKTPKGTVFKGNLDVELTLDMSQQIEKYDTAILFSGDSDFAPVVDFVKNKGKKVIVLSSRGHVARELARAADKYIPFESFKDIFRRKKSPRQLAGEVYSDKRITQKRQTVNTIKIKKRGSNLRTKP